MWMYNYFRGRMHMLVIYLLLSLSHRRTWIFLLLSSLFFGPCMQLFMTIQMIQI